MDNFLHHFNSVGHIFFKNWIKINQELLENIPHLKRTTSKILSYIEPVSVVREEGAMLARHSIVKSECHNHVTFYNSFPEMKCGLAEHIVLTSEPVMAAC